MNDETRCPGGCGYVVYHCDCPTTAPPTPPCQISNRCESCGAKCSPQTDPRKRAVCSACF